MDHVECSGNEFSLWHCRAKGKNNPLSCTHLVELTCAGKSPPSDSIVVPIE